MGLLDCRLRPLLCTGPPAADEVRRAVLGTGALSPCTVLPLAAANLGRAVALLVGRAAAVLEGTAPLLLGRVALTLLGVSLSSTAAEPNVAAAEAAPVEALWRPAWRADRVEALVTGAAALARVGASSSGVTLTAGLLGPAMDQEGRLLWLPLEDGVPVAEEVVEPLEWRLSPALPLLLAMLAAVAAVAGPRVPVREAAEPVERQLMLSLLLMFLLAEVSDKRPSVLFTFVTVSKLRVGCSAAGRGTVLEMVVLAVPLLGREAASGDAGDSREGGVGTELGTGHCDWTEALDIGLSKSKDTLKAAKPSSP